MRFLTGGDELVAGALRDLHADWAATGSVWRDAARSDFERQHLDELDARCRAAIRALKRVEALLREGIERCS